MDGWNTRDDLSSGSVWFVDPRTISMLRNANFFRSRLKGPLSSLDIDATKTWHNRLFPKNPGTVCSEKGITPYIPILKMGLEPSILFDPGGVWILRDLFHLISMNITRLRWTSTRWLLNVETLIESILSKKVLVAGELPMVPFVSPGFHGDHQNHCKVGPFQLYMEL